MVIKSKILFFLLFFFCFWILNESKAQCPVSITPAAPQICFGDSVTLVASGVSGTYLWSPATGLNAVSGNTVKASPATTTIYKVVRSCGGINKDSATVTVTVNPIPTAVLLDVNGPPDFTNCAGASIQYDLTVIDNSSGNISNYLIIWGDGTANYSSSSAPINLLHTYNSLGFFTIQYIVTSNSGCVDTSTYDVFNGSNPAVGLGNPGNTAGCVPLTLSFPISGTINNPPGTIYTVTVNDGSASQTFSHPPPLSVTHSFLSSSCGITSSNGSTVFPNSFSVSIVASNPCGTSAAAIVPIYLSTPPIADFTYAPNIGCINTVETFTNQSIAPINIISGSCDSNVRMNWLINPTTGWVVSSGQIGGPTGIPSGSDVLGITFNTVGIYTISLITRGVSACGNDTMIKQVCITEPPSSTFSISPLQGCIPLAVSTNNTTITPVICDTITSNWNVGFVSSVCSTNGGNWNYTGSSTSTTISPTFLLNDVGTYSFTLTSSNVCGSSVFVQNVNTATVPIVTVNPVNDACNSLNVIPSATFQDCNLGISAYNWSFLGGNPLSSSLQNPPAISYTNGTASVINYTILASATNACGTGIDSITFALFPNPIPNAIANPYTICIGQNSNLSVNQSNIYSSINWSPVGSLNTSSGSPVVATPTTTTIYTAIVTNSYGCSGSDTTIVNVNPLPIVNAGPAQSVCINGASIQLAGTPLGGIWSGNGVTASGLFTPSIAGVGIQVLTYSYTSPATGCTNNTTTSVTINGLPIVDAGTNLSYCDTSLIVALTGATPSGGAWSGPGVSGNNLDLGPLTSGNYTLYYFYTDGNGCSATDSIQLTITSPQTANAGSDFNRCINDPVVILNGTPAGGTWSGTGISGNSFTPSTAGAGTFILTYTYGTGSCLAIDQITATVNPLPLVNAGLPQSECIDASSFNLTGTPAGGTWSGTGVNIGGLFSPSIAGTGVFTLTYSYTNPLTGCSNTATVDITVNSLPIVDAGPNQSYCDTNLIVALTGATPSGGAWSGPGVSGNNLDLGPLTSGNYTLYYFYTDGNGCSATDSIQLTITSPQTANAGSDFNRCINDPVVILNGTPAGGTWSGTGISGNSFTPSTAGAGTFILTYTYGTGSCLAIDQLTATVNPLPLVNAGLPQSECIDASSFNLTGTPAGGTWSGTGVNIGGLFSPSIAGTGVFTLTYSYTNPLTGCSNTATVDITVNSLPIVDAGPNQSYCDTNLIVALTGATPSGGAWSGPGVSGNNLDLGPLTSGNYTLYYFYTDGNGCSATDSIQLTITSPQTANAGSDFNRCINDPVVILNGTPAGGTWSGTGISGNSFTPSTAGAGTFILTYTYGTGSCLAIDQITATVNPLPLVNAGLPQSVCIDASSFNLTGTPAGGTWSGTGVNIGGLFSPSIAGTGVFTLTYSYTNPLTGCSNTAIVDITVNSLPIVDAGPNQSYCDTNLIVALTGATPSGGAWSGPGVSGNSLDLGPLTSGNYTLYYFYTDGNGCSATDSIQLTITSPQTANAGSDFNRCINDPVVILNGTPAGGTWSGTGISGNSFTPSTAGAGTFILTYTYGTGSCLAIDQLTATVNPLPLVNAGLPQSVCIDASSFNLTGTPAGGTWSGTGVNIGGLFSPSTAGTGVFTLTYSYTNPLTGCSNTATVDITVNSLPIVDAGPNQSYCDTNLIVALTGATPSGGAWSGPGVSGNNLDLGPLIPGNYTLYYFYTDANGCSATDSIQLIITVPVTTNAGSDINVCVNDATVLLNGIPIGGIWSGQGINAGNFDPLLAGVGVWILTYTTGTGSCQTSDQITATVYALPLVDAGLQQNICVDAAPFQLTGTPTGGNWTGLGVSPIGIFSPFIAGVGQQFISYTYIDPVTTCTNYDSVLIIVNNLPVVFAGNDTAVCDLPSPVILNGNFNNSGIWSGIGVSSNGVFTSPGVGQYQLLYTYSDNNGCTSNDTLQITVTAPLVADAGPGDTVCVDVAPFILQSFYPAIGGSWSGTGITNVSTGLFDPALAMQNISIPTFFTLYYSYGSGNCFTIDSTVVLVNPLPIVTAGIDQDTCISVSPFNLTGFSPLGGIWSGNGIQNSNGLFSPAAAGPGIHILEYTYQNNITGCTNSDTILFEVYALPIPNFTIDSVLCLNTNYTLLNTTIGGQGYYWDFGNGTNSSLQQPIISYASIGYYSILLLVTSPAGCIDSIRKIIRVVEPPLPSFSLTPNEGCGPLIVAFNNTSSAFEPVYVWDFGNGITDTSSNPAPVTFVQSLYNDTVYHIQLSIQNLCGSNSYEDSVLVHPLPTAYFGQSVNSGCSPLTVSFSNNSFGLPTSFYWDFGDGNVDTASSPLPHTFYAGVNDTVYVIYLVAINQCGSDTLIDSIHVYPNTVNAFFNTNQTSGCAPLGVDFTNYSTGATVFAWDFGDGNISNAFNAVHQFDSTGTFDVSLIITNNCSFDTAHIQIVVWGQPQLDFEISDDSVCTNEFVNLFNTSIDPLINQIWYFGDGDSSLSSQPSHFYTNSGTYIITLIGTSAPHGCQDTIYKPIVILPLPIPQFDSIYNEGCQPLTLAFTNSTIGATGYLWNFDDGNVSTLLSPTHTYADTGIFNIQLISISSFGCADSLSGIVVVHPKPESMFTIAPDSSCIAPVDVQFTNISTNSTGSFWDFGNGITSTNLNPQINFNQVGAYPITLYTTSAFGCKDTSNSIFNVYPTPDAEFTVPFPEGCEDLVVDFLNSSLNGIYYFWDFGDGANSNLTSPTNIYTTPGIYTVNLFVVGTGGCRDTATQYQIVQVHQSPVASFNYIVDPNPTLYGAIDFQNNSFGAISYEWNFGDGQTSNLENPIHRYENFGDYIVVLIASNSEGCTDTSRQVVHIDYFKGLYVPNAFTPTTGPETVRKFLPIGKGLLHYKLFIFDSWGILLWEDDKLENGSPKNGWDGVVNGTLLQQDVYVWKIQAEFLDGTMWIGQYRDGKYTTTGTVTLLR